MAIAMRLRNQLQSVYKLDPLRNEVSGHVVRARPRRGGHGRAVRRHRGRVKRARLPGDGCRLRGADGERHTRTAALPCVSMRGRRESARVVLPRQRSGEPHVRSVKCRFAGFSGHTVAELNREFSRSGPGR